MPDVDGWIQEGKYASFFASSGLKNLFAVISTDDIKSVIKNPSCMCIATSDMSMLDISNYVPATISILQHISVAVDVMTKLDVSVALNNLDVVPLIKAINAQRERFKRFDLDMVTDGVSLSGLSEKVMYQTWFNDLQYPDKKPANAFQFLANRMGGYKSQDAKAKRIFGMTLEHLNSLLPKQKYLCGLCYCQLTADTASADRISNNLGHIDGNILISCVKCNTSRKDMSLNGFRYKKLLEFNSDRPVIGYDANALYLGALGNDMPCGRLTTIEAYPEIVEDIKNDKFFGILECDIHTPEHLKQYFGEMTPSSKYTDRLEDPYLRAFAQVVPISWYGNHQDIQLYQSKLTQGDCLIYFTVSNARREGDANKSKAMISEMMKLVGNSAFGLSGMDMSKHKEIKYASDKDIKAKIEHFTFHGLEELNDACELTMMKRKLKNKNPIHLSIAIYLAKLRMLQSYYHCTDFYFDRSDFQYQEMDTDSAYIAFSCDNPFQDCIKPELREHFVQHKYDWSPRDYSTDVAKFDRRTPGLFKDEWSGDAMVSLSSKNYICYLPDNSYKVKVSAKGVQQGRGRNNDVLSPKGFEMLSGSQTKTALSSEFMSTKAQELVTGKTIDHYNNEPGDHGTMGKIKRFNRTLKQRLTKCLPRRLHKSLSATLLIITTPLLIDQLE
ncbi:unnamed protein product [Phytophthora lilii]|uniref:Unnamed protein product n=1 Tax=Phytophthora lilii TaxID=2077276 RepID=A0A9W6X4B6_9STRA|nr:unnamed protein product [Phytophthora lilii]